MDLHTWLDQPENKGRATWLAEQLGVKKAAVSLWRDNGVPLKHMERVAELCQGVDMDSMFKHALDCRRQPA